MLTIYVKNHSIYVKTNIEYVSEKSRNVILSTSKNPTPRITQGFEGWEGGIGVRGGFSFRYSRPLLIANGLTQPSYSRGLLKAPEKCLLINYCRILDLGSSNLGLGTQSNHQFGNLRPLINDGYLKQMIMLIWKNTDGPFSQIF